MYMYMYIHTYIFWKWSKPALNRGSMWAVSEITQFIRRYWWKCCGCVSWRKLCMPLESVSIAFLLNEVPQKRRDIWTKSGVAKGLLQGRPLQLPRGRWPTFERLRVQKSCLAISYCFSPTKSAYKIRLAGRELDMGCQLLTQTFPCWFCRGLSCSGPLATPNQSFRKFIEYPQMWVWPQVPLEGLPPLPPPRTLGPLPPHQTGPSRPGALQKEPRGGGGKGEGEGGEGRALAWGKGHPIAMGDAGGHSVGARPTSGGSQLYPKFAPKFAPKLLVHSWLVEKTWPQISPGCSHQRFQFSPANFTIRFCRHGQPQNQDHDLTPTPNIIECFRGRHRGGRQFFFNFAVLRTLFSCSKMGLFYLKTCTPLKGTPWSTAWQHLMIFHLILFQAGDSSPRTPVFPK